MIQEATLTIRLVDGEPRPRAGQTVVNECRGGPETLLRWLETQLGLPQPPVHASSRITEYAGALDDISDGCYSVSMQTDRWATAAELLQRHDELLLAGWDESDSESLPQLVRHLARATKGRTFVFPSEASRLKRVLEALEAGQVLPSHRCILFDPSDRWPVVWREVLDRLTIIDPPAVELQGLDGSAQASAQSAVHGGEENRIEIEQDETFRYVQSRSETAAVEFVAAALAADPEKLPITFICCENDAVALRLDACLGRIGLPTMGATAWSRAHPVLQILPLSLALCWEPVDPQVLLDFLTLPFSPLPQSATSRLAAALAKEPGLGSSAWEDALAKACSEENDPDGKIHQRLNEWLFGGRAQRGGDIETRLIRSRCGMVAKWATGRAALLEAEGAADVELIDALYTSAGQAALLGELAESQGTRLTEPQLARLLDEALGNGAEASTGMEAAGGPVRIRSLSELDRPCDRLIWLGLGTEDAPGCRWSVDQLRRLHENGIELDDGTNALSALRAAEARGYCQVKEAFLAVLLPQDLDQRWHPIWLAVRNCFSEDDMERPPVLEDLIAAGQETALTPFTFQSETLSIEPPQMPRPHWEIPPNLLRDRETVSASELQDRLACPLKWTLNYRAKIRSSSFARLPDEFQLKGRFCHSILEQVLGGGGELPQVEEAIADITQAFDERLPLDAAPLAQPDKIMEAQRLRTELANATRVLIETLESGGYRIVGIEVELFGEAFGKPLCGWIDCLAARQDGAEAIIDFKYGGRGKYYSLIQEGKAVQLATYAYGRHRSSGTFPAVAYLIFSDGLLYSSSGSRLEGEGRQAVIDGPAIQTVWEEFSRAIHNVEDWLTSQEPVPARPLQSLSDWPEGATIVLNEKLKPDQSQEVCRYCEYSMICGLQELS